MNGIDESAKRTAAEMCASRNMTPNCAGEGRVLDARDQIAQRAPEIEEQLNYLQGSIDAMEQQLEHFVNQLEPITAMGEQRVASSPEAVPEGRTYYGNRLIGLRFKVERFTWVLGELRERVQV